MATIRRWYVYLVCGVSLQLAAWALIGLISDLLLVRGSEFLNTALFEIALLIVGVPVFAIHWFWAQRSARREPDERSSGIRQLYLYGMLASFVVAGAVHGFTMASIALSMLLKEAASVSSYGPTPSQTLMRGWVVLVCLALLWLYHWRVTIGDARATPANEAQATLRRVYVLGLSAAGATVTFLGLIHILRWMLDQFGTNSLAFNAGGPLSDILAGLAIGLLLWLPYWARAQRLFAGADQAERASALRKFYLYAFVFSGALGAVGNATLILAGSFRAALSLPPTGDIRGPLPIIVGMGLMWAYHAYVLRADERQTGEAPRQAGIRRLYQYLVAGVGLTALLIGMGGVISAAIQSVGGSVFGSGPRELLAYSGAGLLVGLPVWALPWWQIQRAAAAPAAAGGDELRSLVRRIYLYLFIFAATMTVLGYTVYLVYRILSQVFGLNRSGSLLVDLGQSIAYTLIGAAVLVFHGLLIRADGAANRRERATRMAGLGVVVLDGGDDGFGRDLLAGLQRDLPGLKAAMFDTRALAADPAAWEAASASLAAPGLIVASWNIAGLAAEAAGAQIAQAVASSPAQKLLVPVRLKGWEWAGVDPWSAPSLVAHTLQAVKQWAEGDEVRFTRPASLGVIVGWIAGILLLLVLVLSIAGRLLFSGL